MSKSLTHDDWENARDERDRHARAAASQLLAGDPAHARGDALKMQEAERRMDEIATVLDQEAQVRA